MSAENKPKCSENMCNDEAEYVCMENGKLYCQNCKILANVNSAGEDGDNFFHFKKLSVYLAKQNQLYYDIMMLKVNGKISELEIVKLMKIVGTRCSLEDINNAKIWWISGHTLTKLCSGEIKVDANHYKQYLVR